MISSQRAGTLGHGATGRLEAANPAANIWATGERDGGGQEGCGKSKEKHRGSY